MTDTLIPVSPDYQRPFHLLIGQIADPELHASCEFLTDCPRFSVWPAARNNHHAYRGGLLAHTVEVATIALGIADLIPDVNRDILLTAALWHDWGKVEEYAPTEDGGYRSALGAAAHIPLGADKFTEVYRGEWAEEVRHCILAHHGRVDWGSPVEPATREALILHQADMLSASYGPTRKEVER